MKRAGIVVALAAGVSMAVVSWLGVATQPHTRMVDVEKRQNLANAFPERIGAWRLDHERVNVPLAPDVAEQVKRIYTEVFDRTYVNDAGERMFLTVAYGRDQSDGFKVHRPEVCYAAQGFTVSSPRDGAVDLTGRHIPVKRVDTHIQNRNEPVTYWMVIGDKPVTNPARHKVYQIEYALQGLIADGLLVRVSSLAPLTSASYQAQDDFIRAWIKTVPASQQPRLFGV
jgi:EpsI family protein